MKFSRVAVILSLWLVDSISATSKPQDGTTTCEAAASTQQRVPPMVVAPLLNSNTKQKNKTSATVANVMGCCASLVDSPTVIGQMPQMTTDEALEVLDIAKDAWKGGSGTWPQMSLRDRVKAIQTFMTVLQEQRTAIIEVLMWEIGKNLQDATSEFDRTMQFIQKLIETIHTDPEFNSEWQSMGGDTTRAFVRRAAIGIILCLGPYNYPLNETYATLIPALLMGNIVIMKIPTVGGLTHLLTMDAFRQTLPEGTINFVSGSGRTTMPPLMASGFIDGLAFIGGSKAADELIRQHPSPHRLKLFLQLEAKNMGIFLSDIFQDEQLLEAGLNEAISGTTSYNGQRCTALKLLFVPANNATTFVSKFVDKIHDLRIGLPWQESKSGLLPHITPLPNQKRVQYMKELIEDAISKGAKIMNNNGGDILGGPDSTLMVPAVLYPVTSAMKVYWEEQFGPVIPIAPYETLDTVIQYGRDGTYGQQVSIFTSAAAHVGATNNNDASILLDIFSQVFGKININSQCGRSPDNLPFSGRRSSALGVMSISYALQEFSIPTAVVYKNVNTNSAVMDTIQASSKFMESLF